MWPGSAALWPALGNPGIYSSPRPVCEAGTPLGGPDGTRGDGIGGAAPSPAVCEAGPPRRRGWDPDRRCPGGTYTSPPRRV